MSLGLSFGSTGQSLYGLREFSPPSNQMGPYTVSIHLFIPDTKPTGLIIKEYLPDDCLTSNAEPIWNYYSKDTNEIKWIFTADSLYDLTLHYTMNIIPSDTQEKVFNGELLFIDPNGQYQVVTIEGENVLVVSTEGEDTSDNEPEESFKPKGPSWFRNYYNFSYMPGNKNTERGFNSFENRPFWDQSNFSFWQFPPLSAEYSEYNWPGMFLWTNELLNGSDNNLLNVPCSEIFPFGFSTYLLPYEWWEMYEYNFSNQ